MLFIFVGDMDKLGKVKMVPNLENFSPHETYDTFHVLTVYLGIRKSQTVVNNYIGEKHR